MCGNTNPELKKLPFFSTCLCDPSIFSLSIFSLSSISKFEMIGVDMENIVLGLFVISKNLTWKICLKIQRFSVIISFILVTLKFDSGLTL